MSEWVAGEAIADAVNAANLFRAKYGHDLISDLPKSTAGDSEHCVLANAFNFDCEVDGFDPNSPILTTQENALRGQWFARFASYQEPKAKALAEILNTEALLITDSGVHHYAVVLPEKIAEIARQFDTGNLDGKYYTVDEDGEIIGIR